MIRYLSFLSVPLFAFLILIFIGMGEAKTVYRDLIVDKDKAQAEHLKSLVGDFLDSGLGYQFIADILRYKKIQAADDDAVANLVSVAGFPGTEKLSVYEQQENGETVIVFPLSGTSQGNLMSCGERDHTTQGKDSWSVVTLLYTAGKVSGCFAQAIPTEDIEQAIYAKFSGVFILAVALFASLVLFVVACVVTARPINILWLEYYSAGAFLLLSAFLLHTLVGIYDEGVRKKVDAYSNALADRLVIIPNIGKMGEQGLTNIEKLMAQFYDETSEIAKLTIEIDGKQVISTPLDSPLEAGQAVTKKIGSNTILYVYPHAGIIKSKVYRNIRNFSALFISCALMGFIWFRVVDSISRLVQVKSRPKDKHWAGSTIEHSASGQMAKVNLLQAAWFLTVFMEGLNASFLPEYLQKITTQAGLGASANAYVFSAFFASFVVFLLPAGRFTEKVDPKWAIVLGAFATAVGAMSVALSSNLWIVLCSRILAGLGHCLLFIAVQVYIFQLMGKDKSAGAAKIVFAQNGGILSGAAVGALLVFSIQEQGIFFTAMGIAMLNMVLVYLFVPLLRPRLTQIQATRVIQNTPDTGDLRVNPQVLSVSQKAALMLKDIPFVVVSVFVGSYSKIIYNGVIFFAVPVILLSAKYQKTEIGQLLMLFAMAVMVSNHYATKLSRKINNNRIILLIGMIASGLGCIVMGYSQSILGPNFEQLFIIVGITIVGAANGFIAAPVISDVLSTATARGLGVNTTTAIYRLIERMGHVLGPILLGALILFWAGQGGRQDETIKVFAIIGFCTFICATIYYLSSKHKVAEIIN